MKNISKITAGLIFCWLIAILLIPATTLATVLTEADCKQPPNNCLNVAKDKCAPCLATTDVKLDNPLGEGIINPTQLYARIIYSFMGMTGVVALIIFIIGGYQWMTAGGNAEKVKKGLNTIVWAVFGIILIFASYAILRAIFETLKF